MKILVFSDVHVRQGASIPGRLEDQEAILRASADLAIHERVDAVLFGGDMFEGPAVPSSDYLRVKRSLILPLAAAGIPVVATSGNGVHDSAGSQGEENALAVLHEPGVFDVYTRPALAPVYVGARIALVVACVPWASVARLRAHLNGSAPADDADVMAGQLVIRIMENLRAQATREYPGVPCVCLSHFATSGWRTPTGLPTDSIRDVVLPLGELERVGFDAVCLGHIHAPGIINELGQGGSPSHGMQACEETREASTAAGSTVASRASNPIVSLGSPLCLNHGEEHVEHGVWVVEFAPQMRREAPDVSFRPLDGRKFRTEEIDAESAQLLCDGTFNFGRAFVEGAIVRVKVTATRDELRRLNVRAIEAAVLAAGAHHVKVEPVPTVESRARVAGVTAQLDPTDALELWLGTQNLDPGIADGVRSWAREANAA